MPRTNAQKLAQQKYDQKSYDQILIKVRKGMREFYKNAAEGLGLGQMELFRIAVEEYIRNHGGEVPVTSSAAESISAEDKRLLAAAGNLPIQARKQLIKFLEQLALMGDKGGGENGDN